MIEIRFLIPIFVISKENDKYKITDKSFKYLKYLQILLKDKAKINFMILGSENELSRELTLNYFNEDEYIEYDQGGINYLNRIDYNTLNTVVGKKTLTGYNKCKELNPDLIILMKNNHFISKEWLEEIIIDYNKDNFSKNYYGLNHNNIFFITTLDNNSKICINDNVAIIDERYKNMNTIFEACLLGIPRYLYLKHDMGYINQTEITINNEILLLGGNPYYNKPTHIFNIKSLNENYNITQLKYIIDTYNNKNVSIYTLNNNELLLRDIEIINSL